MTARDLIDALRASTRELIERTQAVAYSIHEPRALFVSNLDHRDLAHREHLRLLSQLEARVAELETERARLLAIARIDPATQAVARRVQP